MRAIIPRPPTDVIAVLQGPEKKVSDKVVQNFREKSPKPFCFQLSPRNLGQSAFLKFIWVRFRAGESRFESPAFGVCLSACLPSSNALTNMTLRLRKWK